MGCWVFVPPEVYAAVMAAQRHLDAARRSPNRDRWNGVRYVNRRREHVDKAQRLISRAVRILGSARLTSLLSECIVPHHPKGEGP